MNEPLVADRDCDHCQIYFYIEDTGRVRELPPGSGVLMRRPKGTRPPCRMECGCPKGTPENQKSLTPQNRECYRHYKTCQAINCWPDDPTVARHAQIIRGVEDSVAEMNWAEFRVSMVQAALAGRI